MTRAVVDLAEFTVNHRRVREVRAVVALVRVLRDFVTILHKCTDFIL